MITTNQHLTHQSNLMTENEHGPSIRRHSRWGVLLLIVGLSFLGAVFSAGCTVRVSYRLAEIEAEKVVLRQRQQFLQEQLAVATAREGAVQFAHQAGLVQNVPANAPRLDNVRGFASR